MHQTHRVNGRDAGYGFGLAQLHDDRFGTIVGHSGGLPGYVSKLAMIPELRLGVAVLTNQESGAAFEAIVYHVLDHYLGAKAPDYPAIFDRLVRKGQAEMKAPAGSWYTAIRPWSPTSNGAMATVPPAA